MPTGDSAAPDRRAIETLVDAAEMYPGAVVLAEMQCDRIQELKVLYSQGGPKTKTTVANLIADILFCRAVRS